MEPENLRLKITKDIFNKRTIGEYLYISPDDLSVTFSKDRIKDTNLLCLGRPFPRETSENEKFFSSYDENLPYCSHRMFVSYLLKRKSRYDESQINSAIFSYVLNNAKNTEAAYKTLRESSVDVISFLRYADHIPNLDLNQTKILTELSFASTSNPVNFKAFHRYSNYLESASIEERLKFIYSPYVEKFKLFNSGFKIIHKEEALRVVFDYGMNLQHTPTFNDNIDVASLAVFEGRNAQPSALSFASDRLKDDPYFVLKACERDMIAIIHASDRLRNSCKEDSSVEDLKLIIEKIELAQKLGDTLDADKSNTSVRKVKI